MVDVRIWVDADGVLADFASAVESQFGVHPDAAAADTDAMWAGISSTTGFWQSLPEMPDAHKLWAFIEPYRPVVLTGVGGNPADCRAGKKQWVRDHFSSDRTVVTNTKRKPEFARPGDILIDDSEANIHAWRAVGGIGIHHQDAKRTLDALRTMGVLGEGRFSPEFVEDVQRRQDDRSFVRAGYTGYVLSPQSQRALAQSFGVREGVDGPYRLVCQHITRSFPAGFDTVEDAHPAIEVVGHVSDDVTGHDVLVVTIDGHLIRPDGSYYHITYGLDDGEASLAAREASGEKRPKAADSNRLLQKLVLAAGGDTSVLENLPLEDRIPVEAEFALLSQSKVDALPKPKPVLIETVSTEPWEFAGISSTGDLLQGQKTTRVKGDIETVSYELILSDGRKLKHADEGVPAIEKRNTRTGEVLFRAWASFDNVVREPPEETVSPVHR